MSGATNRNSAYAPGAACGTAITSRESTSLAWSAAAARAGASPRTPARQLLPLESQNGAILVKSQGRAILLKLDFRVDAIVEETGRAHRVDAHRPLPGGLGTQMIA